MPTGWTGTDFFDIRPGDTDAVRGCGAVGLMARRSALLQGAGRVIAIDRLPERLALARDKVASATIDYSQTDSVLEELRPPRRADEQGHHRPNLPEPGPRDVRDMIEHVQAGDLDPSFLVTHRMSLEDAPRGYEPFKKKEDGCLRAVFAP